MSFIHVSGILFCLMIPGCTRSQTDQGNQPQQLPVGSSDTVHAREAEHTRLAVELKDGSRITGVALINALPFKMAFTTINAPLTTIRSVRIDDGKGAVVEFRNGDLLHGELQSETLPIETVLGRLDVPIGAVKAIYGVAASLIGDLVAYYPLDGTPVDASGHGHDGINHGAVPGIDRSGREGGACTFDGEGAYIGLPNGLMDPAGPGFSWSLWIFPQELTGERYILYGGANTAESGFDLNEGTLTFSVVLEDGKHYPVQTKIGSHRYVHIACVYRRGQDVELWVNGKLEARSPVPDGVLMHGSNQHSAAIGSYAPEQPNHMHYYHIRTWLGLIDEVRIYSRPLERSEIELLASDL